MISIPAPTSGASLNERTLYVVFGPQRMADLFRYHLRLEGKLKPADLVVRCQAGVREMRGRTCPVVLVDTDYPYRGTRLPWYWREVKAQAEVVNATQGRKTETIWFTA